MKTDALNLAKERLRIPELWARLGMPGQASKSCCSPFREDANPSFSVFDDGRHWKDHASGEHGDAIDFLARARGPSNGDACREFLKLAGIENTSPAPPPSRFDSRPANAPSANNTLQPLDWPACVAAITPEHQARLAEWRGYSPEFVAWLQARQLIGLFDGERIAFPLHDAHGGVVAAHYRRKEDGKWRYFPRLEDVGENVRPLIIGDPASAKSIFASRVSGTSAPSPTNWDGTSRCPLTLLS